MSDIGITVGVATCGRPHALERCLRALAGQSAAPSEVIIVDQAPSESSRAVVAASGLPAVHLEQAKLGVSVSRNLALSSATQSVLAVTDDDCAPDAGWLAAIGRALDHEPRSDAVTGPILPLGEAPPNTFAISLREADVSVDHSAPTIPWDVGSGGNFAARVSLLRDCGGWDERLGPGSPGRAAEDAELIYRLLLASARIRYEPAAVVRHQWQTPVRRLETRWSYGYGVGAMCGLLLGRRDAYALRMLAAYSRLHVRPLFGAVRRRERYRAAEHWRALASLVPGLAYGVRASRMPASSLQG